MKKLTLNERFEVPMQIEDVENGIFKIQETIIAQVVKMEDEALVKAIRDYVQQKALKEKKNIRLMLLDESIADEIIKLGIEKYAERKKEYCCNCGVELNNKNKALNNMCNECKYGLDY